MKLFKKIIKKYFSNFAYFYQYLRNKLFVVIFLSIAVGILDGVGLTMFLPLLEIANGSKVANENSLGNLRVIIDFFKTIGFELNLKVILLFLFLFFLLKGIMVYYFNIYKAKVSQSFVAYMRLNLTFLFSNYRYENFLKSNVGQIQNSFTSEVSRVTSAYINYVAVIQSLTLVIVYMLFAFAVDWEFALLISLGGFFTNFIYKTIYSKTKNQSTLLSHNSGNYQGLIIQYIYNFKYLKSTGLISKYSNKLISVIKQIEQNNFNISKLGAKISSSREPLLIAIVCLVIYFQVVLFNGKLSLVLISLLFFYRALSSLMAVQNSYNSFLGVSGSLYNVEAFENELKNNKEVFGNQPFLKLNDSINVDRLFFSFDNDDNVLNNISLEIKKNQSIALVGESGSGKTTLVNLICGLLKPTKGQVNINGKSIVDFDLRQYQNRIGYISQEPVIFNDTIFNNVTFWDTKSESNLKKFQDALQKASIIEFVNSLTEKEETILGNNGVNLSGGQKQRISIAREIYKEIDILVLDEATSALDSDNERLIQENIEALHGDLTIIIIAHRLSTIRNVDTIYLLEKGKITSQGTFDELIIKSERFKKMVELQEI